MKPVKLKSSSEQRVEGIVKTGLLQGGWIQSSSRTVHFQFRDSEDTVGRPAWQQGGSMIERSQ